MVTLVLTLKWVGPSRWHDRWLYICVTITLASELHNIHSNSLTKYNCFPSLSAVRDSELTQTHHYPNLYLFNQLNILSVSSPELSRVWTDGDWCSREDWLSQSWMLFNDLKGTRFTGIIKEMELVPLASVLLQSGCFFIKLYWLYRLIAMPIVLPMRCCCPLLCKVLCIVGDWSNAHGGFLSESVWNPGVLGYCFCLHTACTPDSKAS